MSKKVINKPETLIELWKCIPETLREEIKELWNFADYIIHPFMEFLENDENILKYPEGSSEYNLILFFLIKFVCSRPFEQFEFIVKEIKEKDEYNEPIRQ